jgi:hypothetical protein
MKKINSHKIGNPTTKDGKGIDVVASSQHLVDIFNHLGFTGRKCKIFQVPELILKSPKSVIREFIKGLFEADGTLKSCGCSLTSKCEKLLSQVQILLLGFNIISSLNAYWNKKYKRYYYTLNLNRQASDIFYKEIGFISKSKTNKLLEVVSKPHSNAYKEWNWIEEITSIEKATGDVYDIEVENDHYYLGNGFISHNSNLKFLEMSMAGAACIATNSAPYQCIKHNETGILIDDPVDWYDAISTLLNDVLFRKKLVKNAQEQIREEFSWQCSKKNLWLEAFLKVSQV